jgi:hypothetical protein
MIAARSSFSLAKTPVLRIVSSRWYSSSQICLAEEATDAKGSKKKKGGAEGGVNPNLPPGIQDRKAQTAMLFHYFNSVREVMK